MKPTPTEQKLLDAILCEVRNVATTFEQLSIHIDPYVRGGGLSVCFAYNGVGRSEHFEGPIRRTRKPRRAR